MQYEPDPRDDMDSYGEICYEVGLDLEPNKYAKLRKAAMLEAGRSFNHLVQSERADDHTLVTSGIYSWCR